MRLEHFDESLMFRACHHLNTSKFQSFNKNCFILIRYEDFEINFDLISSQASRRSSTSARAIDLRESRTPMVRAVYARALMVLLRIYAW